MNGLVVALIIVALLLAWGLCRQFRREIDRSLTKLLTQRRKSKTLNRIQRLTGDSEIMQLMGETWENGVDFQSSMKRIQTVAARSGVALPVFEAALRSRDRCWRDIGLCGLKLVNPSRAASILLEGYAIPGSTRTDRRKKILDLAPSLPIAGSGGVLDLFERVLLNTRWRYPWGYLAPEQFEALESLLRTAVQRYAEFSAIGIPIEPLFVKCYRLAHNREFQMALYDLWAGHFPVELSIPHDQGWESVGLTWEQWCYQRWGEGEPEEKQQVLRRIAQERDQALRRITEERDRELHSENRRKTPSMKELFDSIDAAKRQEAALAEQREQERSQRFNQLLAWWTPTIEASLHALGERWWPKRVFVDVYDEKDFWGRPRGRREWMPGHELKTSIRSTGAVFQLENGGKGLPKFGCVLRVSLADSGELLISRYNGTSLFQEVESAVLTQETLMKYLGKIYEEGWYLVVPYVQPPLDK